MRKVVRKIKNYPKLHRKIHCTCNPGKVMTLTGAHYRSCDLMYDKRRTNPKKRKRILFFYPMINRKQK